MLLLFVILATSHYTCGQGDLPPILTAESATSSFRRLQARASNVFEYKESGREPISINITKGFVDRNDTQMCKNVSQIIYWANFSYECQTTDLVTDDQIKALSETLDNVKNYVQSIVKINKNDDHVETIQVEVYNVTVPKEYENTDLGIGVFVRPLNTTVAQKAYNPNSIDNRPQEGLIFVNPSEIPTKAQNINDNERDFFLIILHSFFHVMGIDEEFIQTKWVNRRVVGHYSLDPIRPFFSNQRINYNVSILTTPVAKQYAERHWNITDKLYKDVGMRFYNYTYYDKFPTHLDPLYFFNEVLTPEINKYAYISDATFAVLEDMGWYSLDYAKAEPNPYNYGPAIGEDLFINFTTPNISDYIPNRYFKDPSLAGQETCSWDYRAIAKVPEKEEINCSEEQSVDDNIFFCNNSEYFAPYGQTGIKSALGPLYSFQFYAIPTTLCDKGSFCTEKSSGDTKNYACMNFTYDATSISLIIDGANHSCQDGFVTLGGDKYSCPNNSMLVEMDNYTATSLKGYTLEKLPGDSKLYVWYIVIIVFLVLIGAVVAVFMVCKAFCMEEDDEADPEKTIQMLEEGREAAANAQASNQPSP